jgi:hypothetical protein
MENFIFLLEVTNKKCFQTVNSNPIILITNPHCRLLLSAEELFGAISPLASSILLTSSGSPPPPLG